MARFFPLLLALALLGPGVAQAARIETGGACSLVDAISSANTNAAVGGCVAGDPRPRHGRRGGGDAEHRRQRLERTAGHH